MQVADEPQLDLKIEKNFHYDTHFGSRGVSRKNRTVKSKQNGTIDNT
jgi:hypothetical protein